MFITIFMANTIRTTLLQKYVDLVYYVFEFYQYSIIQERHLRHKIVISAHSGSNNTSAITIHHGRLRDNLNASNSRLHIDDNIPILFAVGVALGMAKNRDGSAALSGLVAFLTG